MPPTPRPDNPPRRRPLRLSGSAYHRLTPDVILDAVATTGLRPTGSLLALNSMENRVFDIGFSDPDDLSRSIHRVAKFYRPGRWTHAQIHEEHLFLQQLARDDMPVVCPLADDRGRSLFQDDTTGIWFTLFPRAPGRNPEEVNLPQLRWLARLVARLHLTGAREPAPHRLRLDIDTYGYGNLDALHQLRALPDNLEAPYLDRAEAIFDRAAPWFRGVETLRLHGDLHLGNIVWGADGPQLVDFDDMVTGPPVQDLWLLAPGRSPEDAARRDILLEEYLNLRPFDRSTLRLIEPLRALRLVHFAAWIARRWEDPAFPRAFPFYGTAAYWREQLEELNGVWEALHD